MNLRLFVIVMLISAITLQSQASGVDISLYKGDFIAAEKVNPQGETVVHVKLSKSGKAKMRKLNKLSVSNEAYSEIAAVNTNFKFRVPIDGDSVEMGPYSEGNAP